MAVFFSDAPDGMPVRALRLSRPIPPQLCGNSFPLPRFRGAGRLAGSFPDGLVTVEGAPAEAEIRVLWRSESGVFADGVLVARTMSAQDGTWVVEGLRTDMRFDVVARKGGFNDVIVADLTPVL